MQTAVPFPDQVVGKHDRTSTVVHGRSPAAFATIEAGDIAHDVLSLSGLWCRPGYLAWIMPTSARPDVDRVSKTKQEPRCRRKQCASFPWRQHQSRVTLTTTYSLSPGKATNHMSIAIARPITSANNQDTLSVGAATQTNPARLVERHIGASFHHAQHKPGGSFGNALADMPPNA